MSRAAAVVLGRNEGPRLPRCLRSLLGRFDPIVYVDSASSDGSVEAARALGADVVPLDLSIPFTFGRARNIGAARALELAADVEFVQFVDADSEIAAGWAEQATALLQATPGTAAVHGRVRERGRGVTLYDRLFELEFTPATEHGDVFGGMALLRVEAYRQIGGYTEGLRTFEDHELSARLRRAGWQIRRLDADMAVHEAGMTTWRDWWTREHRAGYARAQLLGLHGGMAEGPWRRAYASIWFWGGVLPLSIAGAALGAPAAALLLGLGYPLLFTRIARRMRRNGFAGADAALYAGGRVVGKFPQLHGIVSSLRDRARSAIPAGAENGALPASRVLYLVNEYPKITHTFVRTEIAAVERAGVPVERVAIRRPASPVLDAEDQREARRTRVLLDVGLLGLATAALHNALRRPRRLAGALGATLRLGWRSERGVARHLAYLAEACVLREWSVAAGIAHVHASFGANPAAVALLCRRLGGPPYSFTAHGPEEFDRAALLGIPDKVAEAAFVVVVSEAGRAHLQQCCPPSTWDRMHVVRCTIDARFNAPEVTPVPADRRIVFVGRLCTEKAPLLLLEAVARLNAEGHACELTMIGDGPLGSALAARVRQLGLDARVRLLGWASADAVKRHILEARALVLPSFAEGLPVVLMEALALRRPVVCTAVGGIAELVVDGDNGWLVPPGNLAALASAIGEVLKSPPADLQRMGDNGAQRVARQHDPQAAGRRLAALFGAAQPGRAG